MLDAFGNQNIFIFPPQNTHVVGKIEMFTAIVTCYGKLWM